MLAAPRDRWFVGEGFRRTGPLDFEQLIQSLLDEPDPRAPLLWHKGFGSWTRAEDIPLVERRLAAVLAPTATAAETIRGAGRSVPAEGRTAVDAAQCKPGSPLLVYGGLAAGVTALALLGWQFWPRAQKPIVLVPPESRVEVPAPVASPHRSPDATRSPAQAPPDATRPPSPIPPAVTPPVAPPPRPSTPEFQETELPRSEMRKLRGVAAWSRETLELTVENPTAWRVTELRVRVSRLEGDELVQDAAPVVLLPPARPVAPVVTDLMDKVAPDRKKPGLNPLDTGSFTAKVVGPPPEGFRWEIESALGYALH